MGFSYYYYRFLLPPFPAKRASRRGAVQDGKPSPSRLAGAGWSDR